MTNKPLRSDPSCATKRKARAKATSPMAELGAPPLIQIADFKASFLELMEEEVDQELMKVECDLR